MVFTIRYCATSTLSQLHSVRRMATSKKFVLEYYYVSNMLEKRVPHREAHLKYADSFVSKNILQAGGALLPEVAKGLLLFEASDREVVETFAKNDPYVTSGLVTKYHISEWAVAVGKV